MKQKLIFFGMLFFAFVQISKANLFRVGYPGTPRAGVDFSDFQSAHDAAAAGDTIQVYGSGSGAVYKKLNIIGFGYNFDANANLQAIGTDNPSNFSINFYGGSNGSVVTGISGNVYIVGSDINGNPQDVSNITINRCRGGEILFYDNADYGNISNINIYSCYDLYIASAFNQKPVTNISIYNTRVYDVSLNNGSSTLYFQNCIFRSAPILNSAAVLFENCIFETSGPSGSNIVSNNSLFAYSDPYAGTGNLYGVNMSTVFTYIPANQSSETYYQLLPGAGNPARNHGKIGTTIVDCGIFGGSPAYSYRLSGVPAVPAIYQLTAPSTNAGSNPYNVTVSVRANN